MLFTLKNTELKIIHRNVLPIQKGGFQETSCPKDRQDGTKSLVGDKPGHGTLFISLRYIASNVNSSFMMHQD